MTEVVLDEDGLNLPRVGIQLISYDFRRFPANGIYRIPIVGILSDPTISDSIDLMRCVIINS